MAILLAWADMFLPIRVRKVWGSGTNGVGGGVGNLGAWSLWRLRFVHCLQVQAVRGLRRREVRVRRDITMVVIIGVSVTVITNVECAGVAVGQDSVHDKVG